MDSSQRALQTYGKLYTNFKFVFEFLAENRKFFKRKARREYWWNCNELYKLMESFFFFFFLLFFEILAENRRFGPKTEKYSKEYRGVNIDQKAQCFIYKWIRLYELYKLYNEFFFKLRIRFRNFARKTIFFFQKNSKAWILMKLQRAKYQWIRLFFFEDRGTDRQTDGIDFRMYSEKPFQWYMTWPPKRKIS